MSSHYYLMASLPSLYYDAPVPMTYEQFLEVCREQVSPSTFEALSTLFSGNGEGKSGLVGQWEQYYTKLMNELTEQRCRRLGKSCPEYPEREVEIKEVIKAAMNSKNPLEAENLLIKSEFEFIDSRCSQHYFDDYALTGYALKLRILGRKAMFSTEEGSAEFSKLLDYIQSEIKSV